MTTIKLKNGSGAPTAGDLVAGEPALDLTNKRLYTEDSGGTVIEVGTNPTSVTTGDITATGTATFAGLTTTGNVSFGDNDKAIFGAGSDLQIYHDGSNSYIDEVGVGSLLVSATNLRLRDASANLYLLANSGADVRLYHNGSQKLATTSTGIDVTGNTESDTVTIGTSSVAGSEKLRVNGTILTLGGSVSAPAIGIGDTNTGVYAPTAGQLGWTVNGTQRLFLDSTGIDVTGTVTADGLTLGALNTGSDKTIQFNGAGTSEHRINFGEGTATDVFSIHYDGTDASPTNDLYIESSGTKRTKFDENGDISFYDSSGTSQNLFWDASASSLGLGTTSPAGPFHLETTLSATSRIVGSNVLGTNFGIANTSTGVAQLLIDASNGDFAGGDYIKLAQNNDLSGELVNVGANPLKFSTANTERMRIDSSGNLLIGGNVKVSQPALDKGVYLQSQTDGDVLGYGLYANDAATNRRATFFLDDANAVYGFDNSFGSGSSAEFVIRRAGSEQLRVSASGNLLVGTTALPSGTATGVGINPSGLVSASRSGVTGGPAGIFNRTSADGDIVDFRKDGTTVGSISTKSGALSIGTGDTGIRFRAVYDDILPVDMSTNTARDAAIDLGDSSYRFKDLYRSGSTISTSDQTMKQDIRELTEAEYRVAVACKPLLKSFRFIQEVETQGESAPIRFGIIAQELENAFTAEGLNADDYAMFRRDTVTDENNVETQRLGVCYENLLAFIIAAI